jgi:hypothetical protein
VPAGGIFRSYCILAVLFEKKDCTANDFVSGGALLQTDAGSPTGLPAQDCEMNGQKSVKIFTHPDKPTKTPCNMPILLRLQNV